MRRIGRFTAAIAITIAPALAAQTRTLPASYRQYVAVDAPVVAIIHAKVLDGTGTPAKNDQTILIRGEKISAIGPASSVTVPADARVVDATGKTLIPGIIGLHDHMYYGGMKFMGVSYPRLFLSAGVTTIRTTGSVDSTRSSTSSDRSIRCCSRVQVLSLPVHISRVLALAPAQCTRCPAPPTLVEWSSIGPRRVSPGSRRTPRSRAPTSVRRSMKRTRTA